MVRGVQAEVDGATVFLGNARLMREQGADIRVIEAQAASHEAQGRTVSWLALRRADGFELAGLLAFGDTIKPGAAHKAMPASACDKSLANLDALRHADGGTPTAAIRDAMQRTMQEDAAVFRTGETLAQGVERIRKVHASFDDVKVSDVKRFQTAMGEFFETRKTELLDKIRNEKPDLKKDAAAVDAGRALRRSVRGLLGVRGLRQGQRGRGAGHPARAARAVGCS